MERWMYILSPLFEWPARMRSIQPWSNLYKTPCASNLPHLGEKGDFNARKDDRRRFKARAKCISIWHCERGERDDCARIAINSRSGDGLTCSSMFSEIGSKVYPSLSKGLDNILQKIWCSTVIPTVSQFCLVKFELLCRELENGPVWEILLHTVAWDPNITQLSIGPCK